LALNIEKINKGLGKVAPSRVREREGSVYLDEVI